MGNNPLETVESSLQISLSFELDPLRGRFSFLDPAAPFSCPWILQLGRYLSALLHLWSVLEPKVKYLGLVVHINCEN